MTRHKKTTEPRQLWTFFGLLLLIAGIFGYAVLPYLDPARGKLVGRQVPEFVLPTISGGEPGSRIDLEAYRGQVVLLDFWASWCPPCRAQAPIMDRVAQRFEEQGVSVIGVNTGDEPQAALAFIEQMGLTYPSVVDVDGSVSRAFGASQLPTLVVIDPEGKVVNVQARVVKEAELETMIKTARAAR